MAFLLVKKIHLVPKIVETETPKIADSETWMSIRFKGKNIGYSVQSFTGLESGYIVDSKSYLRIKTLGRYQEIRTITSARLSKEMALNSFHFILASGPIRFQLTGILNGLDLSITTITSGYKNTSVIKLNEVPRLSTGLMPFLARQGLEKGQKHKISIFDPSTLSSRWVNVYVEDRVIIPVDGENIETHRIRMDYLDRQLYSWVAADGQVIKEEGLLGFSMIKTTPEKAVENLTGRADLPDVVISTSAPTNVQLKKPRRISYLRAQLEGVRLIDWELDGGRQKLDGNTVTIDREKIDVRDEIMLPQTSLEHRGLLRNTLMIQSTHPAIIKAARDIIGDEKSPLNVIDKIVGWVYDNLEKRPTMSFPNALQVLKTKVGDCNEHATLTTALLRAAGIPAQVVVGVLYFEKRFYYHAWVEAYWGKWLAIDPVLGQVPADATHIRFLTGGLDKQSKMVTLIGRLKVNVIETN